jgi:hypothetical protein
MHVTPTAHFASLRSDLIVVENPAVPEFSNGRQIGTRPGLSHRFHEHRCTVKGQKSIDFLRSRAHAADSPGIWELAASDVPEVTDLLAELATADIDRIREILVEEEAGSRRMIVLETARAVLQRTGVSERRPGNPGTKTTVTA